MSMKRTYDFGTGGPVSEMAIVDTFTKLIFGEEDGFSSSEELIIQAFRLVDTSVARDSHKDMGAIPARAGGKGNDSVGDPGSNLPG